MESSAPAAAGHIPCRRNPTLRRRTDDGLPPLQQHMEDQGATKRRRMEDHRCLSDALEFSPLQIEDLPEELQHLVLSLQSPKEAARTSIVSRKWREVWARYPNLCFDGTEDGSTNDDSIKIKGAKFIETVNSVIQKHTGTRLNKFSIRCYLKKNCSDHLDRWVHFATASKAAKIIDMNLGPQRKDIGPIKDVYHFPLEALDGQDGPFVQSLFLTNVSIKPHLDICGFKKLEKLHLHGAQIIGDIPELLLNCPILEDLELIACSGVSELNIPHPLDKLRHLLICNMCLKMVDFRVTGLTPFGYQGFVIPIVLHGCSNLEKVTITFFRMVSTVSNKGLVHAITGIIPSISAVKELHVCASMWEYNPVWLWSLQVHGVTRPTCMLVNLRKLTCEITIITNRPNSHNGIVQMAQFLDCAPQLETLELHMCCSVVIAGSGSCWCGEGQVFPMRRLDHLKTVYMSGFRCYRPQIELLHGILENGDVLEHVTIEPMVKLGKTSDDKVNIGIPEDRICDWARLASERFGKDIVVVKAPRGWRICHGWTYY